MHAVAVIGALGFTGASEVVAKRRADRERSAAEDVRRREQPRRVAGWAHPPRRRPPITGGAAPGLGLDGPWWARTARFERGAGA